MSWKTLDDMDFAGKVALVRVDINVPVEAGQVTDATRIEKIVPTVKDIIAKGGMPVLLAHFGRPKGKVVPAPSAEDPEKAPAKLAEKVPPGNPKYSLSYANPQPQANLEFSFHIYNHMTLKDTPETAILKAFITVARDKDTRTAVSEANHKLILARATLPTSLSVIYTEAAYTFVSMCKHNWGLGNSELTFDHLSKYLSKQEGDLVREWTTRGFADADDRHESADALREDCIGITARRAG